MLWLLKRNFESIGAAVEQIEINAAMHKLCKQETPSITLPFTTLNWDEPTGFGVSGNNFKIKGKTHFIQNP